MEYFLQHVVAPFERWDTLAYHYYGDALQYGVIIAANPAVDVEVLLPVGLVLAIPIIEQANEVRSVELPPWM